MGAVGGTSGEQRAAVADPAGIPAWMFGAASATTVALLAVAVASGTGTLPRPVAVAVAAIAVAGWLPPRAVARATPLDVTLMLVPVAVLLLSGAPPVLSCVLGVATARVVAFGPAARAVAFAAGAVAVVVARAVIVDASGWFLWKSYVELGAAVGWALRGQRLLLGRAEERAHELAHIAALEERRRIARDVHDTLAHSLAVMMIHVNSARLHVDEDPRAVRETLDELAVVGRASLDEVRRSVGLLSAPAHPAEPADPASAAFAVEELVGSFRRAGVDVDLQLDVDMAHMGRLAGAPTHVWGIAYRIVQESVTNAVRHAPGAAVSIAVTIDDCGLRLRIVNACPPSAGERASAVGGHGVRGMRERAALAGGRCVAGPDPADPAVWTVGADLPLGPALVVRDASCPPLAPGYR